MNNKELQEYLKTFPDDFQPIISVYDRDQQIIWEPLDVHHLHPMVPKNQIWIGGD